MSSSTYAFVLFMSFCTVLECMMLVPGLLSMETSRSAELGTCYGLEINIPVGWAVNTSS